MSEYQYYEFQTIDRSLSNREMGEIERLSSRVDLNPYRAVFVYNYGDFPAKPDNILSRYFDAMIYLANWGSKRLMFRFPESAVNIDEIRQYCFPDMISLKTSKGYAVLDIDLHDEESCSWIEGESWLLRFLSLRQDLMLHDYRLLYLAWLKAITLEPPDEDEKKPYPHPPVPPGLKDLSQPLIDFVELFELDTFLVRVAAELSPKRKEITKETLQNAVSKLTTVECRDFLLRLASGEPNLSHALNLRLREFIKREHGGPSKEKEPLPVLTLLENAERAKEQEERKQRELEEAKRIERLDSLAGQAPRLWKKVNSLIAQKQVKAYDEAVEILVELKELAEYKGTQNAFQEKINKLHETHNNLSGLRRRMESNDLKAAY